MSLDHFTPTDDVSLATAWLETVRGRMRFDPDHGWRVGDAGLHQSRHLAHYSVLQFLGETAAPITPATEVLLSTAKLRAVVEMAEVLSTNLPRDTDHPVAQMIDCANCYASTSDDHALCDLCRAQPLTARTYLGPAADAKELQRLGTHAGKVGRGHSVSIGWAPTDGTVPWSKENTWPRWVWENAARIIELYGPNQ
jgi:hypothetical protein